MHFSLAGRLSHWREWVWYVCSTCEWLKMHYQQVC